MKTLELNQMESVQGGGCAEGAVAGLVIGVQSGIGISFGPWGLLASAVVGCIAGSLAD